MCLYFVLFTEPFVLRRYMINPTEFNLRGKTAFFWTGTAALTSAWAWFRLPEVKVRLYKPHQDSIVSNIYHQGRTYEELDILFAKKIPARKFNAAEIQVYEDSEYNIFLDD